MAKRNQETFTPPSWWLEEGEKVDLSTTTKYDERDLLSQSSDLQIKSRAIRRRINWLSQQESTDKLNNRNHQRRQANFDLKEKTLEEIPITWFPKVDKPAINVVVKGQGQASFTSFMDENKLRERLPFDPIDRLGQNFLIDPVVAKTFVDLTIPGADVVEVGSGPANMTPGIASRANEVIGLEIYPEFREIQIESLAGFSNAKVIIGDALRFDFVGWAKSNPDVPKQVMGNIPFHISEPLLAILGRINRRIERVTLLVGENLKEIINASNNPYNERYSRLAFITSLFDVEALYEVNKSSFWPVPPVNGGLVSLTPRECDPSGHTTALEIRRMLVEHPELSVAKVINSLANRARSSKQLDNTASNRYDRRQTRRQLGHMTSGRTSIPSRDNDQEDQQHNRSILRRVSLSQEILNTPFQRLNNQQVQSLAIALENL